MNEELKQTVIDLLSEVTDWHSHPESADYCECDKAEERCLWCCQAIQSIELLKSN